MEGTPLLDDALPGWVHAIRRADTFGGLRTASLAVARRVAHADGASFAIRHGEHAHFVADDAVGPLWTGERILLTDCVSGWVIRHGRVAEIDDVEASSPYPHERYRDTFVRSLVAVPVGPPDTPPLAALGVYWAETGVTADQDQVELLRLLGAEAGAVVLRLRAEAYAGRTGEVSARPR